MANSQGKAKSQAEKAEQWLPGQPEACCFLACLMLVNELRRLERAFQAGDMNEKVFVKKTEVVLGALAETVAATERFDLVLPVLGHGQFSPCFWRWFNWWEDHFGEMTVNEIGQIERLSMAQKPTVRDHPPKAHWLNWRDTPAFTLRF